MKVNVIFVIVKLTRWLTRKQRNNKFKYAHDVYYMDYILNKSLPPELVNVIMIDIHKRYMIDLIELHKYNGAGWLYWYHPMEYIPIEDLITKSSIALCVTNAIVSNSYRNGVFGVRTFHCDIRWNDLPVHYNTSSGYIYHGFHSNPLPNRCVCPQLAGGRNIG